MPIVVAKPHTPEWYAARGTGIGASEIGIAAGLSPYQTPRELYHRKRGELPPIEDNDAMRLGRLLEPVVKSEFTTLTGIVLADPEPPMYRHARHQPIVATPDGIIDDSTIFEAKTASWRMKSQWGDQESDVIPDHYLCQTQAQMAVMDAAVCHVAVLFDGATLKTYRVLRNDELIRHLIAAALELWERIKDGNPPEPNWEHPSTPALIKEIHQTVNDTRIVLTADEVDAWETYERLGKEIKALSDDRDIAKAFVLHGIGDHGAGLLPDGRMVRRKRIAATSVSYERAEYVDVRAVKSDAGRIVDRGNSLPVGTVITNTQESKVSA